MAKRGPTGSVNAAGRSFAKTYGASTAQVRGLTAGDIGGLLIVRENNAKVIEQGIDDAVLRALEKIGLVAEGYAKRLCPVDTGRLRNSITHAIDNGGRYVAIGTNVEYAPFVELGTSRMDERPFLRPAARDHADQYSSILRAELGGRG